jgi:hypothetical protein
MCCRLQAMGWWRPRFVAASLGLVLGVRGLYLSRFGWDPGWMNVTYLLRAKQWVLGADFIAEEPPLTPLLLWGMRGLGLSATSALAAIYLLSHLLMFLGILGLGWFVWPEAGPRRRWAVVVTTALVPLLACETGRNNLGVIVGAGLATSTTALAAISARTGRLWLLPLTAVGAFLAGTARTESMLTVLAASAILAFGRIPDLRRPRLTAAVAVIASLAAMFALSRFRRHDVQSDYAFYTFYDGLPFLMYPHLTFSEYERYRASVGYFGSFEANHGSLIRALVLHPGWALVRVAAKAVDMFGVLLWVQSLTPVGVPAAIAGLRQRARGWHSAWLLAAFAPALVVLLVPNANPHYYVSLAAPLVLACARGFDRWTAQLSAKAARSVAVGSVAVMAILVGWVGRWEPSSSRTINQASGWLEERCRTGCLANVVPQSLERQVWVDLQAGARIVRGHSRSEGAITGDFARAHERDYNYCERVKRARAAGFRGPVLYIDARIQSYRAFDPDFDPEVRYQGQVELEGATVEKRFVSGPDELVIYRMPDEPRCR